MNIFSNNHKKKQFKSKYIFDRIKQYPKQKQNKNKTKTKHKQNTNKTKTKHKQNKNKTKTKQNKQFKLTSNSEINDFCSTGSSGSTNRLTATVSPSSVALKTSPKAPEPIDSPTCKSDQSSSRKACRESTSIKRFRLLALRC